MAGHDENMIDRRRQIASRRVGDDQMRRQAGDVGDDLVGLTIGGISDHLQAGALSLKARLHDPGSGRDDDPRRQQHHPPASRGPGGRHIACTISGSL